MAPQIVLISGCSSGTGLATAVHLAKDAEKRFKVYATMRNLAKKGQLEEEGKEKLGDTLIIKQMDVCSDKSVTTAVKEVLYSTANDSQPQMISRPQMIPKMDRK